MLGSKPCRNDRPNDGFIIVAVLWILGALATLAVIYSLYARETAVEFVNHDERLQAQSLAMAGVELAAYRLTARSNVRPLQGRFAFRQGSATIGVEFCSENSRIDLNFAPKELLAGLFVGLGVQREDALAFADRIIAWRTPLPSGASDSEAALYQAAGKSYGPRHGPFQHLNEVGMVAGLPPLLIDRILPYLTVYSGRPEVNVLVAAPQVLAALPGLTPDRLQLLLTQREGTPQDVVRAQLGIATSYVTLAASSADRVTVDVRFPTGRRIRSQAVIFLLDKGTEPYRVLSWRDDEPSIDERYDAGLQ
jgi:general secretion pathway protein K